MGRTIRSNVIPPHPKHIQLPSQHLEGSTSCNSLDTLPIPIKMFSCRFPCNFRWGTFTSSIPSIRMKQWFTHTSSTQLHCIVFTVESPPHWRDQIQIVPLLYGAPALSPRSVPELPDVYSSPVPLLIPLPVASCTVMRSNATLRNNTSPCISHCSFPESTSVWLFLSACFRTDYFCLSSAQFCFFH